MEDAQRVVDVSDVRALVQLEAGRLAGIREGFCDNTTWSHVKKTPKATAMILRAAIHVHSNWSYDGHWSLESVAQAFADRGYDALLMTEHDLGFTEERRRAHREACQNASTDRIIVIPGIEYSDSANTIHTLVWGDVPFQGAGQETQYVLEQATELGGACVFAHPSRREAWRLFRQDWLKYLTGIEIWNRKTDGWSPSREGLRLVTDMVAPSIVGLDFHSEKQFFPLAVRLPIDGKVDEAKILNVLRLRKYYCEVFDVDMKAYTSGLLLSATTLLEAARRLTARTVRSVTSGSSNVSHLNRLAPHGNNANSPQAPV